MTDPLRIKANAANEITRMFNLKPHIDLVSIDKLANS